MLHALSPSLIHCQALTRAALGMPLQQLAQTWPLVTAYLCPTQQIKDNMKMWISSAYLARLADMNNSCQLMKLAVSVSLKSRKLMLKDRQSETRGVDEGSWKVGSGENDGDSSDEGLLPKCWNIMRIHTPGIRISPFCL